MKPRPFFFGRLLLPAAALVSFSGSALAADQTWSGTTDGNWATGTNWSGGAAPGGATGGASGDTATFNNNVNTTVTVDATRNIKNILFDTGAGAFSFGGGLLVLTNAGAVTMNAGVANTETINSNILLSATASSTYSFINNSSTAGANLNITGNVTGQTTATAETLTLGGSNGGTISGVIGNGTQGGSVALTKSGAGTWTLSGANTYTGTTAVTAGTVKIGNSSALGGSRVNLTAGATLDLNGNNLGVAFINNGAALAGGVIDNVSAGGNVTLTVGSGLGGVSATSTNYTSIDTFSGVIQNTTGTVGLTKVSPAVANQTASIPASVSLLTGPNVLRLTNNNTYTGATTIKGGVIELAFNISNNGGATVTSNIISASSALVLAGGDLINDSNATSGGGTQTFASLTLDAGASHIGTYRKSGGSGTTNLNVITRNVGGVIDFQSRPSGGSSNAKLGDGDGTNNTKTANASFSGGSATILGGWAVFNQNTWAVSAGNGTTSGAISGLGTYSATYAAGTNVNSAIGTSTPGAMTINSLRFNNAGAYSIDTSGNLNIATGGILVTTGVGANAVSINNNNLTSGNGQDLIVTQNNSAGGMTITSNITGTTGLTKSGIGSLTLTPNAANTFTGQLTINTGALILGNANALNSNGSTYNDVVFGGTSQINGTSSGANYVFQNGTLTLNGFNATVASLTSSADSSGTAIVQNASGTSAATLTVNGTTSTTFAGILQNGTGGNALSLTKSGSSTLTLSGASTYTGATTVSNGSLTVGVNNAIGSGSNVVVSGGTLAVGSFNDTVAGLQLASGSITGSTGVLTSTSAIDLRNGSVSAILGGSAGLNKSTADTVTLSAANTFSGTTAISGGSLGLSNSLALQNSTLNYDNQGGSLSFGTLTSATLGGLSGAQNMVLTNTTPAAVALSVGNNNANTAYSGQLSGSGSLTKLGTGTLTLSGTNSYGGATNINTGVLELATNGSMSNSALVFSGTSGAQFLLSGGTLSTTTTSVTAGSAGYRQTGGSATFSGALTAQDNATGSIAVIRVEGGTLSVASVNIGRSSTSVTTEPTAGATNSGLLVSGGSVGITGALSVSGSNSTANARIDAGSVTVGGVVSIGLNNTGRWSVLDVNGGSFTSTNTATGVQLGNGNAGNAIFIVQDSGTATVEKFTFNAASTGAYSEIVRLSSGSIYLGSGGMVRTGTNTSVTSLVKLEGGTLGAKADWSSAIDTTLTGTSTIKAADALDVAHDIALSGVLSGTGGLTKTGGGMLTLSSAGNTYTGNTTITGGTLALTGTASLASPNIIVGASTTFDVSGVTGGFTLASGQTLSGPGTVTGAMNVTGTLSPGNSPGTLSTGDQIWSNGGDYNWQVLDATGAAGTGYDTIAITGTLDLSALTAGQFGINLWSLSSIGPDVSGNAANFNNLLTQSWTILTASAGITGFEAADFLISVGANNGTGGFSNATGGGAFSLGQSGDNLVLTFTAVPEPDAAMLAGGLGLLALLRRRRA